MINSLENIADLNKVAERVTELRQFVERHEDNPMMVAALDKKSETFSSDTFSIDSQSYLKHRFLDSFGIEYKKTNNDGMPEIYFPVSSESLNYILNWEPQNNKRLDQLLDILNVLLIITTTYSFKKISTLVL